MKKFVIISGLLLCSYVHSAAQEKSTTSIPLLGDEAPSFTAESSTGVLTFPGEYYHQWKILFSHPADFTPVCTSEILELAFAQEEFAKLGTKLVVVSGDKLQTHMSWKNNMETIEYKKRAPVKIDFPLVSDPNLQIAREYGMIHPNSSSTKDVRGVFIIDPDNKIRAIFFYPMNIGRNLGEIERTLVALQTADKQQVLIPANWIPGGDVLVPLDQLNVASKNISSDDPGYYTPTWYMVFKRGGK